MTESRVEQFLAALPPHERGTVAGDVLRLHIGAIEAKLVALLAPQASADSPL